MSFDVIEVAHLNGSHRYVVVSGDLQSPKAIALAAHKGLMFWADSATDAPKIQTSSTYRYYIHRQPRETEDQ